MIEKKLSEEEIEKEIQYRLKYFGCDCLPNIIMTAQDDGITPDVYYKLNEKEEICGIIAKNPETSEIIGEC